MSRKPPEKSSANLEQISQAAAAVAEIADATPFEDRIAAIEQKIASIEPLLEQLQVNSNTGLVLSGYVSDLKQEQIFFNRARYAIGCVGLFTVCSLITLLALSVFSQKSPLLGAPASAVAAFIIGMVSGIVFLLVSFTKGIFRTTTERHADGFLPPALEKAVEIYDKVNGK